MPEHDHELDALFQMQHKSLFGEAAQAEMQRRTEAAARSKRNMDEGRAWGIANGYIPAPEEGKSLLDDQQRQWGECAKDEVTK